LNLFVREEAAVGQAGPAILQLMMQWTRGFSGSPRVFSRFLQRGIV